MLADALKPAASHMATWVVLLAQAMVILLVLETMSIRPWLQGRFTNTAPDPFVATLQDDLRHLGEFAGVVQPIDTTQGVLSAMLRLGASSPTKQIYGFPLYLEPRTPFLDGLRADLLARLRDANYPPIVRTNQQWPYEIGYDRLEAWPAFREMIERDYVVASERTFPNKKGYRIYVARRQ